MSSADIIKRLTREDWNPDPVGGKGDHMKFKHPGKPGHVVVHPRKDIRIGTLRSIYRQAGWAWKEE